VFQRKFTVAQEFGPHLNDGVGDIESNTANRTLFARAGFELSRIIPTHSPTEFSVIEGSPI
jgi:hypothetical protein